MHLIVKIAVPCVTLAMGATALLLSPAGIPAARETPAPARLHGAAVSAGSPLVAQNVVTERRETDHRDCRTETGARSREASDCSTHEGDHARKDDRDHRDRDRDHNHCFVDRNGHEFCTTTTTTTTKLPPSGGGNSCFDAKDVGTLFPARTDSDESGLLSAIVKRLNGSGLLHDVNCDIIVPAGL